MVKQLRKAALCLAICLFGQVIYPGATSYAVAPDNILVEGRGWGHGPRARERKRKPGVLREHEERRQTAL